MLEGLLQPTHLLVIFGIALLVFGPKKLPELGKGIGEGVRGFKSAMKEHEKYSEKITIIHCLSCRNQNLDALPNLHQYVAVLLQICTRGYWPMAGHDLRLPVSLRQNAIERMDHAID